MSFGDYLQGSLELILVAAALGFAAVRLRAPAAARLVRAPPPGSRRSCSASRCWSSIARAGRRRRPLPARAGSLRGALVAGVGVGLAAGTARRAASPFRRRASRPVALAVALWRGAARRRATGRCRPRPGSTSACTCRTRPGTTRPSPPASSRTRQVGALHFTEVLRLTVWFYPQNSELLHSAGLLFLDTDFLSPLINIGWMSLCLLAAWCFGRPYGAAATALLGARPDPRRRDAAALPARATPRTTRPASSSCSRPPRSSSTPRRRPGRPPAPRGRSPAARPRSRPRRGFVATGARLKPMLPRGALSSPALAAGLALGTKLNLLAPFGLLTLGVIFVAGAGDRIRTAAIWVAALAGHRAASGSRATWSRRATRCPGSTRARCRARTSSTSTSASPTPSPTTCFRPTST